MARAVGPPNSCQAGSPASSNSRGLDDEQLLNAAAAAHNMGREEQGQKWLKLWTNVLKRTQKTGGKCFVMAKGTGLRDCVLEGNAQSGEVQRLCVGDADVEEIERAQPRQ